MPPKNKKAAAAEKKEEASSSAAATATATMAPVPAEIEAVFTALSGEGDTAAKTASANQLAALLKATPTAVVGVVDRVKVALDGAMPAREGALLAIGALANADHIAEPYLLPMIGTILDRLADKGKHINTAAQNAANALVRNMGPMGVRAIVPGILGQCNAYKAQTKQGALDLLTLVTEVARRQVALLLPIIVPVVTDAMADTSPKVHKAALDCMAKCCSCVSNRDVEPTVPALISCMANPTEVAECAHTLASTTFLQVVTADCLSILVPLLTRGLKEGATAVKRKCCLITDNMSKLVEDYKDAEVFLPLLLPATKRVMEEVSDPECRQIGEKAFETLTRLERNCAAAVERTGHAAVLVTLGDSIKAAAAGVTLEPVLADYIAHIGLTLVLLKSFEQAEWTATIKPLVAPFCTAAQADAICVAFLAQCVKYEQSKVSKEDEQDDTGVDLCNCEFTLAYGTKLLLNNARLRLKRGRRYGLCGPNGSGKSTLMRSIANGQLEGFPPASELRTVYVETDVNPDHAELAVTDYVFTDPLLTNANRDEVVRVLSSVGFSDAMKSGPVSALSGGWKMKLALARAILKNADILLLDEPTNHLDVNNVTWIVNYLTSLTTVTSMIVSHDSGFLDRVCTDIIQCDHMKLKNYRGNLANFVALVPEAKAYYELKSAKVKFVFPPPGFLEGIKSKSKAILKMTNCQFTYPGTTRRILHDISIYVSMASRCAVVGPNGAGKSTMIKLLTGELEPQGGEVWKHPNLICAYVAQHAFHHLEQHMRETPNEYIRWRHAGGEDKESLNKAYQQLTEAEEKAMSQIWVVDGIKKQVETLLGRRNSKRGFEYEVKWVGKPHDENSWVGREKLDEMGWGKVCLRLDDRAANAQFGGTAKALSQSNVEQHLLAFGLEPEFSTHTRVDSLSTSQKVKVVLAAATWNQPHILVLDEPTNYLDRESLGALADAIREFGGGVVMISHNHEFTSALCPETWDMADGVLTRHGDSGTADEQLVQAQLTEGVDAFGNTVKFKQAKKKNMTRKEEKEYARQKKIRKEAGESVSDSE